MGENLCVAIVGAGPAGYYTAEALTKGHDDVCVDIIDRLPTPYGLIRAGVAPDHQSIKNVFKRYEATNLQDNVRFVGNLSLGRDITLIELLDLYDAVILATGAAKDRALGIDGENLKGVIGSACFVGWYNSHPDFTHLDPALNIPAVAVIGNGNVAIDVARILAKTPEEMAQTDIAKHAATILEKSAIKDIYILGRRGPLEGSFTPKELAELNNLDRCVALVDPKQLPSEEDLPNDLGGGIKKNLVALRSMSNNKPTDKPVRLHIKFYVRPVTIIGDEEGHVKNILLERTKIIDGKAFGTGEIESLDVGLVVPCIGYKTSPIADVPYNVSKGHFENNLSHIRDHLYCVGWAKRGPTGTIGTNKPDGISVANRILEEVKPSGRLGRVGLDRIIKERDLEIITFHDWKIIEAAEHAAAKNGSPRIKFTEIDDMIHVAHPEG